MTSLEAIIERLTEVSIEGELWIDGSFTTEKLDPADSDIVLRLFDEFVERTTDEQFETIEWLNSNLKSTHLCDSYLFVEYPEGHLNHSEGLKLRDYWMKQWGFSRGDQPKGIAVVVLGAGR